MEVIQEIRQIQSQIQRLKLKITSKFYADNKWTGVLIGSKDAYFECLEIDQRKIDDVFELDHKFWLANLKKTKEDAAKKQKELESILDQQGSQLH